MRYAFAYLSAILVLTTALAASANENRVVLWRDLQRGDSPKAVAAKLETHPDIKKARARTGKEPSIAVSYRNDGIKILGETFRLVLNFENDTLYQVSLSTDKVCTTNSAPMFSDMLRALSEKYPDFLGSEGEPSHQELRKAISEGTDENPRTVSRILTDGNVVVNYTQYFTTEAPPPSGYTSNAAANSLINLLWNQYYGRERECDGTGNHRVRHVLFYLPKDKLEQKIQEIHEEDRQKIDAAKSNL